LFLPPWGKARMGVLSKLKKAINIKIINYNHNCKEIYSYRYHRRTTENLRQNSFC
jgi:hypothetical protein